MASNSDYGLMAGVSYRSTRHENNRLPVPDDWMEVPLSHVNLPSGFEAVTSLLRRQIGVVPKDNPIEIEAFVENKDIGFVNPGQKAVVKIETFPFTTYGTMDAKVASVSNDAVNDEKRGLIFAARVVPARTTLQVENKTVNLTPGSDRRGEDRPAPRDRIFPRAAAAIRGREPAGTLKFQNSTLRRPSRKSVCLLVPRSCCPVWRAAGRSNQSSRRPIRSWYAGRGSSSGFN